MMRGTALWGLAGMDWKAALLRGLVSKEAMVSGEDEGDEGFTRAPMHEGMAFPHLRRTQNGRILLDCQGMGALDIEHVCMYNLDENLKNSVGEIQLLMLQTQMPLIQENGQRKLGPAPGVHVPPKGTEVFVGKIPKFMNETHIYKLFSCVGDIYQIRLMMDFSGTNRGFCFVRFYDPEAAKTAINMLNRYEILPGRCIGVTESVDNCRLFLGGIPKSLSHHEIFEELSKVTDNLNKVFVKPNREMGFQNRGFAFAEYATHRDAALARRKMIPGKIQMWGRDVHIDWADPEEPEVINKTWGKCISPPAPAGFESWRNF